MLSVIIPSRNDEYLQRTIDDLLEKAERELEIIIVLDGYWPSQIIRDDPRVKIIHHGTIHNSKGMRASINAGMAIAKGDYVMKIDEHCMVDKGFDIKLIADCKEDYLCIPRRYRLDAQNWKIVEDGRPPIDYNYLAYPYARIHDGTCGLHGEEWKRPERKDILIDDTVSCQGSCYFTTRKWWFDKIAPMDDINYGPFTQEAQEVCNKTWFNGGRVIVNKKTWYAHMHKGHLGKKYGFSNAQYRKHQEQKERGRLFCIDYWIYTKDYKYTFEDIYNKLGPWPGWGKDWKNDLIRDKKLEEAK